MSAETETSEQKTPEAAKSNATVASILGEICWLFSMTPSHRHFFMADLEWLVLPAIIKQQFRVYRDQNGRPIGLVLWAKLNEDAEKALIAGQTRLRPQDWDSGESHWIVDVVDLAGGARTQAMIEDMTSAIFKDKPFKYHRMTADGTREVVDSSAS